MAQEQGACGILVTQRGTELRPPVLGMQSINQWTTREVSWSENVLILQL